MEFKCPNCGHMNKVAGVWFHSQKPTGGQAAEGKIEPKIIECINCNYRYSLELSFEVNEKV